MKLRSDSRAVAAFQTPIPLMLPATRAISISNASSLLLRLPQELKDCIYHFVYGDFSIYVIGLGHRKTFCLDAFPRRNSSAVRISVASLKSCRQIYHEAGNVFFSANTFEVFNPRPFRLFLKRIDVVSYRSSAMRSLHLHISVYNKNDERVWDNTFREMAEVLTNLQHLHIDWNERSWRYYLLHSGRLTPGIRKSSFLQGLLELRKLPLTTLEFVLIHSGYEYDEDFWPMDQEQAWVQSMKSAIMGTD